MADDLPEDNEHYTVTLTSADGGATLDARRATIFIRLNGDANGVVSIGPHSLYLVLSEAGPQSTGSQTVKYVIIVSFMSGLIRLPVSSLVREAGSFGTVQVHWRITPDDGNFLEASGTAQFVPRQQNASVNLLVYKTMTSLSACFVVVYPSVCISGHFIGLFDKCDFTYVCDD